MEVKEYVTLPQIAKKYNLSRPTAKKIAEQSGAMYRFGGIYKVDIGAFNNYILSNKVGEEANNDNRNQ